MQSLGSSIETSVVFTFPIQTQQTNWERSVTNNFKGEVLVTLINWNGVNSVSRHVNVIQVVSIRSSSFNSVAPFRSAGNTYVIFHRTAKSGGNFNAMNDKVRGKVRSSCLTFGLSHKELRKFNSHRINIPNDQISTTIVTVY